MARKAATGDQTAFAALVFRHERGLRAWERAGRFDGHGSYAGWLYRIGWNLALDQLRRDKRRTRRDAGDGSEPRQAEPQAPAMIEAQRLLDRLDPQARAAVVLCDGHGWSHSEAAAMLGLPLGTVKSLIARAKARLRATLVEGDS